MRLRRVLRAAASVLVLSLGACATVGPDFTTPAAPTVQTYAQAGDVATPGTAVGERIAGDWWSLLASPEIDQTVRQALVGNRDLAAAQASLQQARDAVLSQASRASLDGNAGISRERVNLSSFGFSQFQTPAGTIVLTNPTFTEYTFGLSGRYDLDLFGARRREHESLAARAEAQAYQTDAAYLTLTAQVVSQAIDIASLSAQVAAAEEIVASDRSNLDLVSASYRLGGGTRLDVTTVQTQLSEDQGVVTPLRQRLAVARHALALLVGRAPAEWSPPAFDLEKIGQPRSLPVSLPSELVRDRPDIRAAEARLHAATAQIGVAQADLYPKLSLTGSITQGALHPEDLFGFGATGYGIGPQLTLPLFRGEELRAKKRMAQDAARGALASYEQTVLRAFVQVADSLQAIAHDDVLIDDSARAYDAASDSLKLQRLRYQDGKVALLPVLDAQRSWARTRLGLIRARAQRLQDSAALLYAVSHSWTGDPAPSIASR